MELYLPGTRWTHSRDWFWLRTTSDKWEQTWPRIYKRVTIYIYYSKRDVNRDECAGFKWTAFQNRPTCYAKARVELYIAYIIKVSRFLFNLRYAHKDKTCWKYIYVYVGCFLPNINNAKTQIRVGVKKIKELCMIVILVRLLFYIRQAAVSAYLRYDTMFYTIHCGKSAVRFRSALQQMNCTATARAIIFEFVLFLSSDTRSFGSIQIFIIHSPQSTPWIMNIVNIYLYRTQSRPINKCIVLCLVYAGETSVTVLKRWWQ